jgi:hypothetical protein
VFKPQASQGNDWLVFTDFEMLELEPFLKVQFTLHGEEDESDLREGSR